MKLRPPATVRRIATGVRGGFTIIEVLIVVLVLSIVAAVAMPMFANTHATRLRAAADMLAADLAYAQIESMTNAEDLRLVIFDAVNNNYRIVKSSDLLTPIPHPVGGTPYVVMFGEGRAKPMAGVTIHSFDLNGDNRLLFGQYGQIDQAVPATVTLACEDRTITLTIHPVLGQVTVGEVQ